MDNFVKAGHIVYVEPARGWAVVADQPAGRYDTEIKVQFFNSDNTLSESELHHPDQVFPLDEESFYNACSRLTESLMACAGDHFCPNEEHSKELVSDLESILEMGRKAQAAGQFKRARCY